MRRCRHCKSIKLKPTERSGLFEFLILPVLLLRPFRCWACRRRHYGFVFG
jgi:hypothetical protein